MAIISRIKSAAKKVVSKVKSAVKSIPSSIKSAIGGAFTSKLGVVSTTAAAINAFSQPKKQSSGMDFPVGANLSPAQKVTATQTISKYTGSYGGINSSGGSGSQSYGPQLPVTISSSSQKSAKGGLSSPTNNYTPLINYTSLTGPVTTTNLSRGGTTEGAVSGGGGYNSGATQSNSPLPTYNPVDPGGTNTTGLAGSLASYYTRKEDGTFEPVTQDPFDEKSDQDIVDEKARLYKEAFGKEPQDVYEDREVRRAMEDRRAAQQALLAPTAELNAVLAQAQRDTLQLRQTAQKEGVVEAVYGAQAAAINYNAAIQALPLQGHIAALQGNLELADSYLNELVTMKKEQIDRQYQYNKGLFDTIYSALDSKEKRIADRMIKENDRQYASEKDLIDYKAELVQKAYQNGAPANVIQSIERAGDKVSAANALGKYGVAASATSGYTIGTNPVVDAWAERIQNGSAKLTDIPAAQAGLRNQVIVALNAMGNSMDGKPTTTELGKNALQSALNLKSKLESMGAQAPVGGLINATLPGTKARDFAINFDTLKSQLSLEAVKYLKGQGQVSDAERALLMSAVSSLDRSQSKGEFKATLDTIINKLQGGSTVLHSPDGTQEVNISDLTPAQIEEAKANGWK